MRKHGWGLSQVGGQAESMELMSWGYRTEGRGGEEGGDCGLMLKLLRFLDGYCITLRDALRDKEDKSRLEVAGGLGGACLWASTEWQDGPVPQQLENKR